MLNAKTVGLTALIITFTTTPLWAGERHTSSHGYSHSDYSFGQNRGYIRYREPRVVFTVLPPGHRTVIVRDTPYYVYENTYYVSSPQGYVVTPPPVIEEKIIPVKEAEPINSYEIQIPNANGSYTLVVLKKTDKGFVGPQGEIYPEHPTVEQLKAMYAKK